MTADEYAFTCHLWSDAFHGQGTVIELQVTFVTRSVPLGTASEATARALSQIYFRPEFAAWNDATAIVPEQIDRALVNCANVAINLVLDVCPISSDDAAFLFAQWKKHSYNGHHASQQRRKAMDGTDGDRSHYLPADD